MTGLFENDRIRLRALEPEDLDFLYRVENDTTLWAEGVNTAPLSRFTLKQYIELSTEQTVFELKELRLIVERKTDRTPVGIADLFDVDIIHRRAGVGLVIDRGHQRQGYGLETLQLLSDYAFNFLQLHSLYAHIAVKNTASIRLFEKAGFQQSGLLKSWLHQAGRYQDVAVCQKLQPMF
ncbi:MAG: GNAT family N-acetyltransferase [Bacteroidales bacterium]|nr:GNAT family N-acetyltransferase [Bacteroidales bacterium]